MRIVVVGTGTGIGKTHVCLALAGQMGREGIGCVGLKPVECGGDEDGRALARQSAFHVKPKPPYRLTKPVSPHRAAREQGMHISLARIRAWVRTAERGSLVSLVETAGGLFTPLARRRTNADLVRALAPDALLVVAPDRLGVLHDLTALLRAARDLPLPPLHTVLSRPGKPDTSTGTNADELERLGICRVAAVFPHAPPHATTSRHAARQLLARLRLVAG
jgi:dethiobiotin synthetase